VADGQALHVRNPDAVRPWQHVLNPLYGYLLLAQELWDKPDLADAWNFGPAEEDARSVGWVVEQVRQRWQGQPDWTHDAGGNEHEARYLKLDSLPGAVASGLAPGDRTRSGARQHGRLVSELHVRSRHA